MNKTTQEELSIIKSFMIAGWIPLPLITYIMWERIHESELSIIWFWVTFSFITILMLIITGLYLYTRKKLKQ